MPHSMATSINGPEKQDPGTVVKPWKSPIITEATPLPFSQGNALPEGNQSGWPASEIFQHTHCTSAEEKLKVSNVVLAKPNF